MMWATMTYNHMLRNLARSLRRLRGQGECVRIYLVFVVL